MGKQEMTPRITESSEDKKNEKAKIIEHSTKGTIKIAEDWQEERKNQQTKTDKERILDGELTREQPEDIRYKEWERAMNMSKDWQTDEQKNANKREQSIIKDGKREIINDIDNPEYVEWLARNEKQKADAKSRTSSERMRGKYEEFNPGHEEMKREIDDRLRGFRDIITHPDANSLSVHRDLFFKIYDELDFLSDMDYVSLTQLIDSKTPEEFASRQDLQWILQNDDDLSNYRGWTPGDFAELKCRLEFAESRLNHRPKVYFVGMVEFPGHDFQNFAKEKLIKGSLYKYEGTNKEAGIHAHTLGAYGDSTGIFKNAQGTRHLDVVEEIDPSKKADMSIPNNYEALKKY